jgi:hypothetical protein
MWMSQLPRSSTFRLEAKGPPEPGRRDLLLGKSGSVDVRTCRSRERAWAWGREFPSCVTHDNSVRSGQKRAHAQWAYEGDH